MTTTTVNFNTEDFTVTNEEIRKMIMQQPLAFIPEPVFTDLINYQLQHKIKKVIYNNPATIIIWGDDSKTVAKCNDKDFYSPESGFAICVAKHYRENYYHDLNKSIKVTQEQWDEYRKAYENELNYWGGGNSEAPTKTISLSRVNHLDIEDKLAIVNGERVKSIKSLIKNKEKKEAKKA